MTAADSDPSLASPYATGGGGTELEHKYAATLLAALLTGDPITELGDDLTPHAVHLQAGRISPVDDIVVEADDNGVLRRVSIGVRRAPKLTKSDTDTVPLLRSYLEVVLKHPADVQAGYWRLTLAVVNGNPAVRQLKRLANVARNCSDNAEFRTRAQQSEYVNAEARTRLEKHLDPLVGQATDGLEGNDGIPTEELTWRILSVLQVRELRLEDVEETDRTHAVRSLRAVVADGSVAAADALFSRLDELAGRYAPAGARVTERMLRADLVGSSLRRSPAYTHAWDLLHRLDQSVHESTRTKLRREDTTVELDRTDAQAALSDAITRSPGGALVITGEPDVGKSALTLRTVEELARHGAVVTAMSLPDMLPTLVEVENLLGAPFEDVFASSATGSMRILVLDGAEGVLAGRAPLLHGISLAALRAGFAVLAVTRDDGARRVREILTEATQQAGTAPVCEHTVPPLSAAETTRLTEAFPQLRRLGAEPRSRWLLERPGLVELLIQIEDLPAPEDLLSEADVFAAVWDGLVRNKEQCPPGKPTPDEREEALMALVRQELVPGPASPRPRSAVLPILRSDGLLKISKLPAAFRATDQFTSDLLRDFALARLLLLEGWQILSDAEAPRWTIRAVRITCQAIMRSQPDQAAWRELAAAFDTLAERFGQRWSELPLEALLTLGDTGSTLRIVWPQLSVGPRLGERTLVRLALQRYAPQDIGEPAVLAPVVDLAFVAETEPARPRRPRRDENQVQQLVLAWLRGLVRSNAESQPLRRKVRDTLFAPATPRYDKFVIEAIAMLGPDLDTHSEAVLRHIANQRPYSIAPAVESSGAAYALAERHPDLLLELAEAYYIDHRDGRGRISVDRGIRPHWNRGTLRQASWYLGPFWQLLNQVPAKAVALINRMLDHAALVRVQNLHGSGSHAADESVHGLELELPDMGVRRYVGDDHAWSWYRGLSVGPYPCMSALLAVERFADHCIAAGVEIRRLVWLLLRDCHNLAMPGLVMGLLVRHLDQAGDLLDPWLAHPQVWHLETSRVTREGVLHVQGPDEPETHGRERRRILPYDVVAYLVHQAKYQDDSGRLTALSGIGDTLLTRARRMLDGVGDEDEELAVVSGWAAAFDPDNYRAERTDGGWLLQFEPPEPVTTALAPSLADSRITADALRLGNTYAATDNRAASVDTLADDIALARRLAADPAAGDHFFVADAVAAVAAAALVAHAHDRTSLTSEDILWAVQIMVDAALHPQIDMTSYSGSIFSRGADRSAAASLPLILLPVFEESTIDHTHIDAGLRACATSLFDEVRTTFAVATKLVWTAPCGGTTTDRCRHRILWDAVQTGLHDARVGDWDDRGEERLPDPISPPYDTAVATTPDDRFLLNHLAPVLGAASLARHAPCIAAEAENLLTILLDAHRRATIHWTDDGYDNLDIRQRQLVTRALISLALESDPAPLTEHVHQFSSHARALHDLLEDVAQLCTYDDTFRRHLGRLWPSLMETALNALDTDTDTLNDHWADWALAALLPIPQIDSYDPTPDTTLCRARSQWLPPEAIADLIDRWIRLAQGTPKAIDALAQFASYAPHSWQHITGLHWAERLIDGHYDTFANQCWDLPRWLKTLREHGLDTPDSTSRWRRIIDGLTAAGDPRAARLQQLDE